LDRDDDQVEVGNLVVGSHTLVVDILDKVDTYEADKHTSVVDILPYVVAYHTAVVDPPRILDILVEHFRRQVEEIHTQEGGDSIRGVVEDIPLAALRVVELPNQMDVLLLRVLAVLLLMPLHLLPREMLLLLLHFSILHS
jgi:hypothetical protein